MKAMKFKTLVLAAIVMTSVSFTSCEKDEPFASVSINETGSDLGGDVTGDGGSVTESYLWNNPLPTADWNMDITSTVGGSFNLMIKDSDGVTVLNQTITAGQGDDSKSGVTSSGASGEWTITVTLTNFNGDGPFSISPGN
jgi:hypothetical protein